MDTIAAIRARQITQMHTLAERRVTEPMDTTSANTLDRLIARYRPGQRAAVLTEARTRLAA